MADLEAVRVKLTRLSPAEHCTPGCPGWFVDAERLDAQRCDDCWYDRPDPLTDDEVELLPEFATERAKLIEAMHNEEHGTAYGMFARWCPHCLAKLSWLGLAQKSTADKIYFLRESGPFVAGRIPLIRIVPRP